MKILSKISILSMMLLVMVSCKKDKASAVTGEAQKVEETTSTASYNVDAMNSMVNWSGSKLTGTHTGTLKVSNGNVTMNKGKVTGGTFTIDMNSLTNTDLAAGQGKEKLEGHLKSPDFFDVGAHPTASFTITKVAEAMGDDAVNALVYGNLTIKGVEKNVGFKAMINDKGEGVSISAPEFSINRTDFGIEFGSNSILGVAKDKAIDDNIKLSIELSAS
jgi:polyisoprenoid-binding protein YceI